MRILILLLPLAALIAADPKPGVKTPGVRIPITALKPDQIFEVPGSPDWILVEDSVWVSNKPKNSVTRIDPKTNKVVGVINVGSKPCSGLAAGFGSLWVPNCGDQTLARVDLKTGNVTATIATGIADSEGGVATGAGRVWLITDTQGTPASIDPDTNNGGAESRLPAGSFSLAVGEKTPLGSCTTQKFFTPVNP